MNEEKEFVTTYWVARNKDGKVTRLAKMEDYSSYAYIDGEWKEFPSLIRIYYGDDDGFEEVSEAEAKEIMKTL